MPINYKLLLKWEGEALQLHSPVPLCLQLCLLGTRPAQGGASVLTPSHLSSSLQVPVGDRGSWHGAAQCTSTL